MSRMIQTSALALVVAACLCPASVLGQDAAAAKRLGAASRFGIDYVFPLSPLTRSEAWPRQLAQTGAGWVNFARVSWHRIEPLPPSGGRHRYVWRDLDRAVTLWQKHGFEIALSLRMGNGWFAGPIRYTGGVEPQTLFKGSDRLPKEGRLDDYRAWIAAMIERYDGDGRDDMPGLKRPVLHYQIGNEYSNPMFWTGTIDDYVVLLKAAVGAARGACKEARIVSNGLRWNNFFFDNPKAQRVDQLFEAYLSRLSSPVLKNGWRRNLEFNQVTIARADLCDVIDVGGNGPWPGMSAGYMAWTKRELAKTGKRRALWDMEARCEPSLVRHEHAFHPDRVVPDGKHVLHRLRTPRDPRHAEAVAWYRDEQARILVRVFVARFAAGFEKVFMGMPGDWDVGWGHLLPNPYVGLCDKRGQPWPAFYAFKALTPEIDGFDRVEKIRSPRNVALYRFTFAGSRPPVWIAWLTDETIRGVDAALPSRKVKLGYLRGPATARTVATSDKTPKAVEIASPYPVTMTLTPTPVILHQRGRQ